MQKTFCPECASERENMTEVCPACGAPPLAEHRQGVDPERGVRETDLEPYITLRYIAKLFKILAVLMVVLLVGEIVMGFLTEGFAAIRTLIGEMTRMLVLAGLMWAAGDLSILLIDAGHDLRVARILLGRINAALHRNQGGPAETSRPVAFAERK